MEATLTKKAARKPGGALSKRCNRRQQPGGLKVRKHRCSTHYLPGLSRSRLMAYWLCQLALIRPSNERYHSGQITKSFVREGQKTETACLYTSSPCVPNWYARNATTSCGARLTKYKMWATRQYFCILSSDMTCFLPDQAVSRGLHSNHIRIGKSKPGFGSILNTVYRHVA